jgi:steroid 5-alpha reductase family enzyme
MAGALFCYTYCMLDMYLFSLAIIVVYMTTMFAIACIKKDNSIVDIAYGPAFILTASVLTLLSKLETTLAPHVTILFSCITIWGIRLALRIHTKNKNKGEDFRYKAWRTRWMKYGSIYFYVRSYIQIFLLQGVVVSIVLLPFTLTLENNFPLVALSFLGIIVWLFGFIFEYLGDKQLDNFIVDTNPKKGKVMKLGLWKYSRHPNYFGESLMWWSLALIAFSSSGNAIVFLSPMCITYLLLYVSGIPMLEKKWEGLLEWEVYKSKTSPFLPLPPKL